MAKFGDRVKETTDTTGTGTLDLNGAATGFLAFADEFNSADDAISYMIVDDPANPTEWEIGKGTLTTGSPNTFARDTVERSSNSNNKVSFTSGTKTVICSPTAADYTAVFGDGGWGTKSGLVRAITTDTNQVAADDGKMIDADASGNSPATLTYTLLAEATAGNGFVVTVRNDGASGTVDVDDDAATLLKQLRPGEAATWRCDGTKWHLVAELIRPGVLSVTGDYTITAQDNGKLILADGSGNSPVGLTLTFESAATLGDDFGVDVRNTGASGDVTLATSNSPADGIDGAASITLSADQSTGVRGTGSTFWTIGKGAAGLPSPDFTSSEQTVTADTQLDVAHGLGAVPTLLQVNLRCKTADNGYGVGDEIMVGNWNHGGADTGATIFADTTNVSLVQGVNIQAVSATTFNIVDLTAASWKWVVKAWT